MRGRVLGCVVALAIVAGVVAGDDKKSADRQQAKTFEKEVTIKVKMKYLLYLPKGYGKENKAWPLVLFLHGAGETGDNLNLVKKHGPARMIEAKKDFPFIVVSPQAPRLGWNVETLNSLLDDVVAKYKVDKDRIYVTGLSMGGFGTWALAAAYPDRFAAIVPICGGGSTSSAKKLKDLPIWVFHGAKDRAVPASRSEAMVNALKKAGSTKVKYHLYPDAGHDSWTETYNNDKMWEWLLEQKRASKKKEE